MMVNEFADPQNGSKRVKLYPARNLQNMYPHPKGSLGRTIQSQVAVPLLVRL